MVSIGRPKARLYASSRASSTAARAAVTTRPCSSVSGRFDAASTASMKLAGCISISSGTKISRIVATACSAVSPVT